jgi:N-acetylgalactosamine-N,N'-diacetylbacillosaminyl-diphospho-undecaprenol 4-alpha-N-acetylgalactosaminyltransferase
MEVIYNPIILPKKTIEPSSLDNKKEQLRIITVGSLTKRKNHIMIFRAIQNTTNFNLTILGGGPLKKKLLNKKRIKKLGNKVCLAGKVKNVNEYLLQSDCFVLTSFTEGFPNVLLEAMAVGLPCISTNCLSGPLELLNENKEVNINNGEFYEGKYGFLINNDDHVGLKRALKYLRNNPEIRVKYAHLSLERSKAYHLDNIYSKFYDFLNN